jgi:hypoxanthine-guanine phosphoribosyltransferase
LLIIKRLNDFFCSTEALAMQIFNDFNEESLICLNVLSVLKGGFRFCADLTKKIQDKNRTNGNGKSLPLKIDFIKFDAV